MIQVQSSTFWSYYAQKYDFRKDLKELCENFETTYKSLFKVFLVFKKDGRKICCEGFHSLSDLF